MTDEKNVSVGIYNDFPGYRLPSEAELDTALRSALVVIDANVLLNLYRYNESTRDDLLEVLRRFGDRLWVPNQVLREFWRNRVNVLASRGAGTDQALAALGKQQRATSDTIQQWAKTIAIEVRDRDGLLERVASLHADLEKEIRAYAPTSPVVVSSAAREPVLGRIEALLEGKAGRAMNEEEWQVAVKEGNDRAKRGEPPGYLDADKENSDLPEGAAGDYLVWRQTVHEATRRDLDVLLITGDEKEDWWWRHRSEFLGPRVELVAELKSHRGRQLYMMRPIDLLKRASALDVTVRKESVDDVERVSREGQQRPEWPAAGVATLLERLENEGWSQAEVIRVAASRGGTIDRETVYQICGFEDDRMLRGFTQPTARITRELQRDGVIADDVEPALTTIYRGGVKAAAFRIPAEMMAILAASPGADSRDDAS